MLKFNSETLKTINMITNINSNSKDKVETSIGILGSLYKKAENQLKEYFSYIEIDYLLKMLKDKTIDYNKERGTKEYLLEMYRESLINSDSILLNQMDIDILEDKLKKLNDLQTLVVINKVIEVNNKDLSIDNLNMLLNKNFYSIDISFDGDNEDLEVIKKQVIVYLEENFHIISDMKLEEITNDLYNNFTIVIKSNIRIDIIKKLELKEKIVGILKESTKIADININEIYIQ